VGSLAVTPIRRRSKSVSVAAAAGRRELLIALRNRVSAELDSGVAPRELAALSRRLLEISEQIELSDTAADGIAVAAQTPDVPWRGE